MNANIFLNSDNFIQYDLNTYFPELANIHKFKMKTLTNHCVVLDLDETLVHTFDDPKVFKRLEIFSNPNLIDLRRRCYNLYLDDVVSTRGMGIKTEISGITRPHLKEFLQFCFRYFRFVIVWSAGQPKYVEAVVDFIFRDLQKPHLVYSYPTCDHVDSGYIYKPLTKIINAEPGLSSYMSLQNSFIIDNTRSTFANVNPSNGIHIPDYQPTLTIESLRQDDKALLQIMQWLMKPEVIISPDIRLLDKSRIFQSNSTSPVSSHRTALPPILYSQKSIINNPITNKLNYQQYSLNPYISRK